jgi:hypothetical protein
MTNWFFKQPGGFSTANEKKTASASLLATFAAVSLFVLSQSFLETMATEA